MKTNAKHFPIWSLNLLSEQTSPKSVQVGCSSHSKFYISQEGSDLEISVAQEELGLKNTEK